MDIPKTFISDSDLIELTKHNANAFHLEASINNGGVDFYPANSFRFGLPTETSEIIDYEHERRLSSDRVKYEYYLSSGVLFKYGNFSICDLNKWSELKDYLMPDNLYEYLSFELPTIPDNVLFNLDEYKFQVDRIIRTDFLPMCDQWNSDSKNLIRIPSPEVILAVNSSIVVALQKTPTEDQYYFEDTVRIAFMLYCELTKLNMAVELPYVSYTIKDGVVS